MAMIYATLIIKGKKTLEQVPSIIRSEVEELLEVLLEDWFDWECSEMDTLLLLLLYHK